MKKILLPLAMLAIIALPATADAAGQCRNQATGKFAKCGSPGAVPAAQYVAKGKTKAKAAAAKPAMTATAAKPAAAKPSLMSRMKMKPKPKPAAAAAPAA